MKLSEDLNDGVEWVFRYYGISLKQSKDPLPPRDDVMEFYFRANTNELEKNLKLQGCPSDLQDKIKQVVTEYWDMFCEDGFHRPIQGFSFQVDTGSHSPIYYKPPKYGPHESEVMKNMV